MQKGKILALDYGAKRVGVASGDSEAGIAFPRCVISNNGILRLVEDIVALCVELDVRTIVIGLPLNMTEDQIENRIMPDVKKLADELGRELDKVDVMFYDERLSSFEADELMNEAEKSYGKKPLGRDAYAAQVILQRFFDNNLK
ncbi:MAG: Holliday junction resolvase RuvX [Candidatus Peregrinibacteria bacterium]